jgi:DNA gyrase subunit B
MSKKKKKVTSEEYSEKNIQHYEGVEAVRIRSGMYVGVGESALTQLAYEIFSNSIDEALAGHCDRIDMVIHGDGSLSVSDNGRGIPYKEIKADGGKMVSAAIVSATSLHAGK